MARDAFEKAMDAIVAMVEKDPASWTTIQDACETFYQHGQETLKERGFCFDEEGYIIPRPSPFFDLYPVKSD
jgi:hypothetical protein